jgi:hypothetical protein
MWTDLTFNLVLLLMSDYLFMLAVSNVCYIVFNFLNLNAGWIHRIDNGHVKRPWRAPDWLLAAGVVLSFVNAFLLGAGADVWGNGTLTAGYRRHPSDHSGLRLPALHPGQGRVSRDDAGRSVSRWQKAGRAEGGHAALCHARRRLRRCRPSAM